MSDEHRMVPWRERLRRSASRSRHEQEEKRGVNRQQRSRSVSPIVEDVRDDSPVRYRGSSESREKPPTRAEMYQAIHTGRQLTEARTLNRVQEKLVADRESLEERIINRVQAEQKAKDKSNNCLDATIVIFTILLLVVCIWAGEKTTDQAVRKLRLLFV